ncbi:tannase/feruloyl esterase family alpha/beta hydrolase [Altericroceibacterium endophyticum]|uniref:Tannase/feruloyl esterase family alpha/beta hydrolase n=1 Tax=Altericroceibacterium endophyticum TaxID=1808508 RepID=A0A6I4T503_9SPHN|nr:tannase/feruloyl esterase family alpha/beta hydrolase [Altericroceibacterium endophyticum]MXO66324.1 tannase/feruloyl esterase family alpha/beta hydrolase [Altericroceibacterium endophyticum]
MTIFARCSLFLLALILAVPGHAACENLLTGSGGGAVVVSALPTSGPLHIPGRWGEPDQQIETGTYCLVKGAISAVEGSRIGFELWLPETGWNHRIRMFGNGGYSSSLPRAQMAKALAEGYAVTATDTGHQGDDPAFAIGLSQSIADWGHRAVHETIITAKALTERFYGTAPRYSYFDGCSTGGHQALQEAQRYPSDFDGIVAGAPGHNRTHLNAAFLWQFVQNHEATAPSRAILTPDKLRVLHRWALKICSGKDGPMKGLGGAAYIDDPLACRFDPQIAACSPGQDTAQCLTPPQVAAARRMYDGTRNPRSGELIYPPWLPGSEGIGPAHYPLPGWSQYWADPADPSQPARASFWRFWAFALDWKWQDFDFDADMEIVDEKLAGSINAMSADLSAFHALGGKLIEYHGLADPVVSPWDSIDYFQRVRAQSGAETSGFYRLFLAPGVGHCSGGPGPSTFHTQSAIEAWVEQGRAPERLIVNAMDGDGSEAMSRPLCPFPQRSVPLTDDSVGASLQFACTSDRRLRTKSIAARYRR